MRAEGSGVSKSEWEISWNDNLSVGVPEIDEEHRQFVARVNDLNKAIVEGKGKAEIERLLDLMLMEAAHHFWNEQQLLARRNYPGLAEHTSKHTQLMAQLNRVMQQFNQADMSITWALKGLRLKQLLVEHLLQEDMKYRDFLRQSKDSAGGGISRRRGRKRAQPKA
jgi:hemerythrin-like metal-binding protein